MSGTPGNFLMNSNSGSTPSRNSGFSPFHDQGRGSMGPPVGQNQRPGYFPPQVEAPMIGGGIILGQRYASPNHTPSSTPPFYPSPYQQAMGGSPHDTPSRGGPRAEGYQRRDSRGWGRGRGGGGGGGGRGGGVQFTPAGHQDFHNRKRFSDVSGVAHSSFSRWKKYVSAMYQQGGSPFQRNQHGNNSSVIERYFKPSMLEDPWKDLIPNKPSGSAS